MLAMGGEGKLIAAAIDRAETVYCVAMNEMADEMKSLAELGISSLSGRIGIAGDLDALITKLQRVKTELVSESPFHGCDGSLVGGNFGLA